jgi:hypothetical protein
MQSDQGALIKCTATITPEKTKYNCAAKIVGCIFVGPGFLISAIGGFSLIDEERATNQEYNNNNNAIACTGLAVLGSSIGLIIGGAIHDHRQRSKNKWASLLRIKIKLALRIIFRINTQIHYNSFLSLATDTFSCSRYLATVRRAML